MITSKKQKGDLGEKLATEYLLKKGYRIITTNYSCRLGEIDIIAHKNRYVFLEVKTRYSRNFGLPEQALTDSKKEKIRKTIYNYLAKEQINTDDFQIDLLAISINNSKAKIRHYLAL